MLLDFLYYGIVYLVDLMVIVTEKNEITELHMLN